jgi:quinol-cytochrome oxidoreductase complex cytochrome b subunit
MEITIISIIMDYLITILMTMFGFMVIFAFLPIFDNYDEEKAVKFGRKILITLVIVINLAYLTWIIVVLTKYYRFI